MSHCYAALAGGAHVVLVSCMCGVWRLRVCHTVWSRCVLSHNCSMYVCLIAVVWVRCACKQTMRFVLME